MRATIQSEGNEVVARGNAEFINAVVDAVQRYETTRVKRNHQLKPKIMGKETQEQINERMAKARAAKGKKKGTKPGTVRGPYKKKKTNKPWSEEDNKMIAEFIMDKGNYKMSKTGNVFIKGFKMNALANKLRRSKKAVSQHIGGTKKFSDARDHMKLTYLEGLNLYPKVKANPENIDAERHKKDSWFTRGVDSRSD